MNYWEREEWRERDARQLDLFGHQVRPVKVTENVLVEGEMVKRTTVVYPEDYLYDPLGC